MEKEYFQTHLSDRQIVLFYLGQEGFLIR
ncbi:MAG: MBL fold metallo-hydrolase, partial [Ruminococcus sp.]|nr:MBL fold metallo-hydrolase [Ruminococcus sp.]